MAANLLRPDENPGGRWGPGSVEVNPGTPRIQGGNALMPRTMAEMLRTPPPPEPEVPPPGPNEISSRVPVPKHHFDELEHEGLHEKMGSDFDDPVASHFVRVGYHGARMQNDDVASKHILEAAKRAYHAVKHGFMPTEMALAAVGAHARNAHEAERMREDEQ